MKGSFPSLFANEGAYQWAKKEAEKNGFSQMKKFRLKNLSFENDVNISIFESPLRGPSKSSIMKVEWPIEEKILFCHLVDYGDVSPEIIKMLIMNGRYEYKTALMKGQANLPRFYVPA